MNVIPIIGIYNSHFNADFLHIELLKDLNDILLLKCLKTPMIRITFIYWFCSTVYKFIQIANKIIYCENTKFLSLFIYRHNAKLQLACQLCMVSLYLNSLKTLNWRKGGQNMFFKFFKCLACPASYWWRFWKSGC